MSSCPCGNPSPYKTCCALVHHDHSQAKTPEQLMRSRYSAHVMGLVDFVVATYHPSCEAEKQRLEISESVDSDWNGLEVIRCEQGRHTEEGFVTFKAYFHQEGQQYCLEERSRFIKQDGLWYYIDGTFPSQEPHVDPRLEQTVSTVKIGRNDPCLCGSGKKFKKCCG
ncbi:MAG: YchJ family protein [Pseudomonadota bacterium]